MPTNLQQQRVLERVSKFYESEWVAWLSITLSKEWMSGSSTCTRSNRSIAMQFLCESAIVSLISGLAGIALGLGVASFIAQRYDIPVNLSLLAVVIAVLASVIVGVLSGIIPARRAAGLDPVEALR